MKKHDAILISSPSNIKYLTKYFNFSENEREAIIIRAKNKDYLITDRRYSTFLKKKLKNMIVLDVGASNFLRNEAEEFFKSKKIEILGFEEYDLTYLEYKWLKRFTKLTPVDLRKIREVKKIDEIKNIKKACLIGDNAFKHVLKKLKQGMTEKEIADELLNFFKKNNADDSFKPIVAFGKNSAIPHHETSNKKLEKNQIVLMDFGVKVNGYCSDMTRTVFFGKAKKRFKNIYYTVLESQHEAIMKIKPNAKSSEIDASSRKYILKYNYPDIIHAVGHGIGIEVHEPPTLSPGSKELLKNEMVFSVEPGIYIPEYGGVRIEDLILLKSGKPTLLTSSNKELIEIEIK